MISKTIEAFQAAMTEEDRNAIYEILIGEVKAGNPDPLLPMGVDIDGDGIVDAFGLAENSEVVIAPGVSLETTIYESSGDDVRGAE